MKNKIKKQKSVMILLLTIFIISMSLTTASNIGISPARLNFENVLRGGYAQKITTITIDTEKETNVEIAPWGDIEKWFNFSETEFSVSRSNPKRLTVSINPPTDTPNGNYTGFIRVKIGSLSAGEQREGHATGIVNPVLDLYVTVEITDIEYTECRASAFKVYSAEKGDDIKFRADILNLGNIIMNPRIRIDIWDQDQIEKVYSEEFSNNRIIPTQKQEIEIKIPSTNFQIDQYWAEITAIDCYSKQTLTFDVLEVGSLRSDGELIKILSPPWINPKETTKIEAYFKNTGQKDVTAYFKGTMTLNDKIIQIIESEKREIDIDREEIFEFYFTPKNHGRYIVTGRVFYDNKRTFERSAIINVREIGLRWSTILRYSILTTLLLGIVYLTNKIKKEKREYKRRLKNLK